ncbi:MAG TPA: hypothetical protein VGR43_04205 [Dehalococcoidia bacterium]|nr:hypothetical protein [Dehalococcoidia bacterium]
MPTYRVYYTERQVEGVNLYDSASFDHYRHPRPRDHVAETEWEEEVEARDGVAALEGFFREHVSERSQVMWIDENGESQSITGVADYDPDKTYIWVENNKLMEYQGLDEATPGMVSCPLCEGAGEVTVEAADEYLGEYGEEIVEEDEEEKGITWG